MARKRVQKSRTKQTARPDYILLGLIVFLLLWGIFTVSTISFPFSLQKYGNPWYYLLHQLAVLCLGILIAIFFFKFPLKILKKWAPYLFFANLLLAIMVFLPKIGVAIGGANRWLNFGGFLLQPSELLKISFILYLSAWLSSRHKVKKEKRFHQLLIPFFIILIVLVAILIFQRDMSTLAIIFLVGSAMYFAAPTPWWHTFLLLGTGAGGAILLIKIAPYRLARFLTFLEPAKDPFGMGYQLRQSLIAIGSGKLFGIGQGLSFGLSRQKFGFVPHPMTDSIFAIIGEELGFIGATLLILLFLLFVWRGLRISIGSVRNFEKLLALGISVWFISQAFFNIGGIIGILPLGGIPLPFFSYGGSHLIAEMIGVGILLNISRRTSTRK